MLNKLDGLICTNKLNDIIYTNKLDDLMYKWTKFSQNIHLGAKFQLLGHHSNCYNQFVKIIEPFPILVCCHRLLLFCYQYVYYYIFTL